jgi:hypothetical protein
MKTKVIPAQITTVEDKIAGSLSFTQITILMIPVIFTAIVYIIFPPRLHLAWYKLPITLTVLFICLILSIRIKGKVVLNWIFVFGRYNLRAKYYLYNKNDSFLRTLYLSTLPKPKKAVKKEIKKEKVKEIVPLIRLSKLAFAESMLSDPRYSFSLKEKKGEMYVAFEKIKK